jgi:hypothetical protein
MNPVWKCFIAVSIVLCAFVSSASTVRAVCAACSGNNVCVATTAGGSVCVVTCKDPHPCTCIASGSCQTRPIPKPQPPLVKVDQPGEPEDVI